jgi:RNA polymerase sigma factor (sigma-70 family)
MILPHPELCTTTAADSDRHAPDSATIARNPSPEEIELADLVARAQAEEPAAQTELVRRFTRRISGYVRLIIRQPDAVEDVVQLVFIKMFRRLGRLRETASFESWLFRLTRNTAVDFIRRRRCRPLSVTSDDELFELPDPSNASATSEIMDALEVALAQVSEKDRELVHLFVQGNSYQSLARDNGLTMGAVKARLHRMRPFLRSFVGEATETRLPAARWGSTSKGHLAA